MSARRLVTWAAALLGLWTALLALAGCAPSAPGFTLPLAADQPTLLFVFTDG